MEALMRNIRCTGKTGAWTLLIAYLAVCATVAWAGITGTIAGIITDQTGGIISGVSVTATNEETGVQSASITDAKGFYSYPTLSVGKYDISVSHPGFQKFTETGININANSSVRVDIKL